MSQCSERSKHQYISVPNTIPIGHPGSEGYMSEGCNRIIGNITVEKHVLIIWELGSPRELRIDWLGEFVRSSTTHPHNCVFWHLMRFFFLLFGRLLSR